MTQPTEGTRSRVLLPQVPPSPVLTRPASPSLTFVVPSGEPLCPAAAGCIQTHSPIEGVALPFLRDWDRIPLASAVGRGEGQRDTPVPSPAPGVVGLEVETMTTRLRLRESVTL